MKTIIAVLITGTAAVFMSISSGMSASIDSVAGARFAEAERTMGFGLLVEHPLSDNETVAGYRRLSGHLDLEDSRHPRRTASPRGEDRADERFRRRE